MRLATLLIVAISCSSAPPPSAAPSDEAAAPASPINVPVPTSDRAAVAQAALDADELRPYIHGRAPMRVVVNRAVNPAWPLTFAGAPIEWVDETSDEPRIEFTLLRIEGDKAAATLRYEIEGVVMHTELRRQGDGWERIKTRLAEE